MRISRALVIAALSLGGTLAFVNGANANESPAVAWTTPANNSTVTGKVVLKANATPASSGTSKIAKWCLTVNGSPSENKAAWAFFDANGSEYSSG
jgi:hypothetical protein